MAKEVASDQKFNKIIADLNLWYSNDAASLTDRLGVCDGNRLFSTGVSGIVDEIKRVISPVSKFTLRTTFVYI